MTSPALIVLFMALVCSTIGTTQPADHGSVLAIARNITSGRTKSYRNKVNSHNTMMSNLEVHKLNLRRFNEGKTEISRVIPHRRVKRRLYDPCEEFEFQKDARQISHPHQKDNSSNTNYHSNIDCVTVITGSDGSIIELNFVDIFRIEYHPDCAYDYLEIRDGKKGYASLLGKLCGQQFPRQIKTTGPYAWLKFHSDDTIEYEGFHINIAIKQGQGSHAVPESCYQELNNQMHGVIDTEKIDSNCKKDSTGHALDVLWTVITPPNTKIYLNFTSYALAKPNECEENVVQVFGTVVEFDSKLAHYCGSMANSVTTKVSDPGKEPKDEGNVMHVRLYASRAAKEDTKFSATFTAFRSLDPSKDEKCKDEEFDCEDNTCIAGELKCDGIANCRLKADEDQCGAVAESKINQPHILVILVIFSLILSGMSFVFLFKCIRKLYQDHKLIKEHIRQSCEDRLDSLVGSRLTLDAKRLQRDSQPRASLERENHTNEMFKQQRSFSKHKSSIDSDFIQETHLNVDDEPWRREVDGVPIETEEFRVERNGRTRRSDMSKKEESIRSRTKESDGENVREKKEIRDVSVGAPDTKESGCQTRESLFQTDPPASSDGSGSNRGFSTFGYSGTTIVRPSTPAQTNTSEITIELLSQVPTHQDTVKSQKKISDRRPMSTETTRSAPDVIIVSKPIR